MDGHNFEVWWHELRFGKRKKVVKSDLTEEQAKGMKEALEYEGFKPKVVKS